MNNEKAKLVAEKELMQGKVPRKERLKFALKENIARRKAQSRARRARVLESEQAKDPS